MRVSLLALGLSAILFGCGGGGDDEAPDTTGSADALTEARACEMATAHLKSEPRIFPNDEVYAAFKVLRCAEYKSVLAEGGASIEVLASKTVQGDTGDTRPADSEIQEWFLCVLALYDQGWSVEVCLPAPEG